MLTRRSNERGYADFGWLQSRHTFSFGQYFDPDHMGFGPLRVINEDRVAPGAGFGEHPHRDMEILSWVLEGTLEHKDSLGTGAQIQPGELQRMSAGTGVTHSEFNASKNEPVHFLQIWILPEKLGLAPGYEQRHFALAKSMNRWHLIGSGSPRNGAVKIHQDVDLYAARLGAGNELEHIPMGSRNLWLQVARGSVEVDGEELNTGDGAAWTTAGKISVRARSDAEILLFDMTVSDMTN
ncbi:pirin family protein [Dyella sp. S184]|uniref:pirin family protein n=1 Tax=Dyella sp. S184 TaxID=1641862 RepID=UPI00131CD779|nr:pirin family protein [Dyella sp. S184]